jgi:hypothetical protein
MKGTFKLQRLTCIPGRRGQSIPALSLQITSNLLLASLLLPISALILRVARFLYVITNPEFDE